MNGFSRSFLEISLCQTRPSCPIVLKLLSMQ